MAIFLPLTLSSSAFSMDKNEERRESMVWGGEVKATLSGGEYTPFWLSANLQGLGSPEKDYGYVRGYAIKPINDNKKFSWGAGVDLVGSWNSQSPFLIHQLYGELKYRSLNALLGAKEIWGEFNNPKLSSGNLLYSGNALPIPQLRIGIFDYAPFYGTKKWLWVKGYIAYGFFTDSGWQRSWVAPGTRHTEGVLYHSKELMFKIGNTDKFPLTGEIGIEMATEFAGRSYQNGTVVNMPHGFIDWLKAIFPVAGSPDTPLDEQTNVQGNMLGSYNIAVSWRPKANWSVMAYFEHYFEDHSQMTFEYGWKDGLWGIDVQLPENPFVSEFVYEFLASKDQTGAVLNNKDDKLPEQVSGRDDYYNHYIYSGWQHWGMGIGNPLALSPIYNKNHLIDFLATRILAHHIGFSGNPRHDLNYRVLLSYSRNWGTYFRPYPEVRENFNALLELSWRPQRLKGWECTIGFGVDGGKLMGHSYGGMISIQKTGIIKF